MAIQPDLKPENFHPIEESLDALSPVLAQYTEALGTPVRIEVPRRRVARPRGRRGWTVHPFAVPGRAGWFGLGPDARFVPLATVCGYPLTPGRQMGWSVSGRSRWGRPLQDSEGQVVALLLGTDVYVLFDLLGQPPLLARLLSRAVLDLSLEAGSSLLLTITGLGPATLEARLRQLRQATEIEGIEASAAWRANDPAQGEAALVDAETLEAEVHRLEQILSTSGRQMRALERRLLLAQRRLADLPRQQAQPDTLARDFDRIAALPGVLDVAVHEGLMQIYTEPIVVEYGLRRYRLGRFRMDVYFDGRIALRNLTNRYESYDHPHIENGRPCLGNIQEWIHRLLAQGEFAAAVEILLRYLGTVNPADWRKAVTHWAEEAE